MNGTRKYPSGFPKKVEFVSHVKRCRQKGSVHQTLDSLGGEMQPQSCFMEISVENHDKQQYMVPGSSDSKLALVWLVNCGVQNSIDFLI